MRKPNSELIIETPETKLKTKRQIPKISIPKLKIPKINIPKTLSLFAILTIILLLSFAYGLSITEFETPQIPKYQYQDYLSTDSQNLQQAIWDLNETGGTVILKEGTHYINETIEVPSNIQLTGNGYRISNLRIQNREIGLIIDTSNTTIRGLYVENCTIGLYLTENVKNCIITDCYFDGVGHAIISDGTPNVVITDSVITDTAILWEK